jgi:hypothetical protein
VALTELGRIRLQLGDLEGAEEASSRLDKRGGIRSRYSPCYDWLKATLRWRRPPSATRSNIP